MGAKPKNEIVDFERRHGEQVKRVILGVGIIGGKIAVLAKDWKHWGTRR